MSISNPSPTVSPIDVLPELLKVGQVEKLTGFTGETIKAYAHAGAFPAPVRCGPSGRSVRWRKSEVLAWLKNLPTAR